MNKVTDRATTMCAAFQATVAAYPDRVALRSADGTVTLTWSQYDARVRTIAAGLAGLGVGRGDTVALMLTNRPEFHLCDTAVLHAGATPFSIYNTNPPELIEYLFSNAGNNVVICEAQFLPQIQAAVELGAEVEHIVCIDDRPQGTVLLAAIESNPLVGFNFDASWRAVQPDDVLTVVYTSGTTGRPKGVELTHANMIANYRSVDAVISAGPDDRLVSYLPDAHAANRWLCHYAPILSGAQVTTIATPKETIAALTGVRPTVFLGVPHTWYKIKAAIETKLAGETSPVKRALGTWAVGAGRRKAQLDSAGESIPMRLRMEHRIADRLVLGKIRAALGLDEVRVAVSGAAPIAPEAHLFMLALGVPVCEAWGMSELAAAATINPPDAIRLGTVGKAIRDVEVTVAEDGELLVRGPNLMKGYRGDPEKTAEAIDADGWLHTGDIGSVDTEGYVRIVDRKKELIISSSGKNMSPANIENAVRVACPLIGAVAAIGDQRPFITAVVALDEEAVAAFAAKKGLPVSAAADLAADPDLLAEIDAGINDANSGLSRAERIRKYVVLPQVWEPGGDELTPTLKLKRKPIANKYAAEIEALYA